MADVLIRGVDEGDLAVLRIAAEESGKSLNAYLRLVLHDYTFAGNVQQALEAHQARRVAETAGKYPGRWKDDHEERLDAEWDE